MYVLNYVGDQEKDLYLYIQLETKDGMSFKKRFLFLLRLHRLHRAEDMYCKSQEEEKEEKLFVR